MNTSLIKTARGKTIMVQHDTNLPRPYSRIHMVQGTRGIFQGYPEPGLHRGPRPSATSGIDGGRRCAEFDHPLWQELEEPGPAGAGHGGMDYIEDYRLIKCLREGLPTDMNVYDAAALSAVVELSGRRTRSAAAAGGRSRFHPRPAGSTTPPLGIVTV